MFTSLLPIAPGAAHLKRDEMDKVLAGVTANVPQCIAVVGIPGAGKSSLLRICSAASAEERLIAFADLRGIPNLDDDSFTEAISDSLGQYGAKLDTALKRVTDAHKRVVLLIDEFDRVAEGVSGDTLARLRALVAGRHLGKVAIVTASTRPLYELCEAVRGSAFYNIFRTLPLSTLDRYTFSEWNQSSNGDVVEDDLWRLTGGFPSLITRLLMEGWRSAVDPIPLGALDGVAAMLAVLSAREQAILRQCALGGDTADVLAMAPKEIVMYLQRSGLIDSMGAVRADIVAQYMQTRAPVDAGEIGEHVGLYVAIKQLETSLKKLVRKAITEGRLPTTCFKDLLDEKQYARLQERKQRFRFIIADDCDAAHFPELGLVVRKYYGVFTQHIQAKKAEFDKNFEVIAPIRNEEFHSHFIPDVEVKRAEVALHDLNSKIAMD